MSKYQPLFDLHQLVQLTHSTTGKVIFYSQVNLSKDDNADEDEAGGWVLSAFTGKTYFEREYRREDLQDLIATTGDKDWLSFAKRFKKAIIEGYFHIMDSNPRECKVIIDNEVHSRMGNSAAATLETIEIDMYPVNHTNRGEKMGEFMFECASYIQARGCILNSKGSGNIEGGANTIQSEDANSEAADAGRKGKSYDDVKLERDSLKSENSDLKKEIERLHAQLLKSGNAGSSINTSSGRPRTKSAHMAMMVKEQLLKKRKGVSALNPRLKKGVLAKGTEFGSDDDDEE
ncbi:hypothetical protein BGZ76_008112 [Entomortierella beljakovae]|nr:hypothetical protein BGZ76_008112 [Entomortierella beljakovae]